MRVSRYLAEFLKGKVNNVFGLQGGAAVHLFDACERFGPKPIYCHHEQGAAFAATAYAKVHGYGVCIVTTGPGGTNAVTPCMGAWQDNVPMMFISGQVRSSQIPLNRSDRIGGMQWGPVRYIVRPITKLAFTTNADELRYDLDLAYSESRRHPSGPVWIDIPLDVQWAEV